MQMRGEGLFAEKQRPWQFQAPHSADSESVCHGSYFFISARDEQRSDMISRRESSISRPVVPIA